MVPETLQLSDSKGCHSFDPLRITETENTKLVELIGNTKLLRALFTMKSEILLRAEE